jgi:hypothetical protein
MLEAGLTPTPDVPASVGGTTYSDDRRAALASRAGIGLNEPENEEEEDYDYQLSA